MEEVGLREMELVDSVNGVTGPPAGDAGGRKSGLPIVLEVLEVLEELAMRQESKLKSRYKKSRCGVEEISLEKSISKKKLKVGGRYDVHAWVRLPMFGCLHASVSFPLFSSLSTLALINQLSSTPESPDRDYRQDSWKEEKKHNLALAGGFVAYYSPPLRRLGWADTKSQSPGPRWDQA